MTLKSQLIAPAEVFDDPATVAAMITSFPMSYEQTLNSFVLNHNADHGFKKDHITVDDVHGSYQLTDDAYALHAAMVADYAFALKAELTKVR